MMAPPGRPAPMLPGLLARKGEARPAMRTNGLAAALVDDDDLGWNDLGEDTPPAPQVPTGSDALPAASAAILDPERLARLHAAADAQGIPAAVLLARLIDRHLPPAGPVSSAKVLP